jgi:hypothetical protein
MNPSTCATLLVTAFAVCDRGNGAGSRVGRQDCPPLWSRRPDMQGRVWAKGFANRGGTRCEGMARCQPCLDHPHADINVGADGIGACGFIRLATQPEFVLPDEGEGGDGSELPWIAGNRAARQRRDKNPAKRILIAL